MLYTYKPSEVNVSFFGVKLKGFSKDTMVTIERIDELVTHRKAQDGSVTVFHDNNATYRVTLNLDQTSEANDFLHTVFKLHRKSGLNLRIPLSVSYASDIPIFASLDTYYENEPTSEYGADTVSRNWIFVCHDASYQISGTNDSGFLTEALKSTIRLIELSELFDVDLSGIESIIRDGLKTTEAKLRNLF